MEVHTVLEYGRAIKTADIVKHLCSRENYAHKYQLNKFVSETNSDWPGTREKMTITSMKRGRMRQYFQVNSQRKKTLLQCVVSSCSTAAYKQNTGRTSTSH